MKTLRESITSPGLLLALYIILSVFTAVQQYWKTQQVDERYTRYNNYVIFKQSHFHLLEGKELYEAHPDEHWDLFKYTPTFALFYGILAYLPDAMGLLLWNLINALVLFFGIRMLPELSPGRKAFICLFILVELATSLQNLQSNPLISGLIIMGFALSEKRNYLLATLLIVFAAYIKVYSLLALVLFLFHPGKVRLAAYTVLWMLMLFFLPAIFTGFSRLINEYHTWFQLLMDDKDFHSGYSVYSWLYSWFGIQAPKLPVAFTGLVLFAIPLMRFRAYPNWQFRQMALASILLWLVIFNHMAESPTFIIAVTGAAVWFANRKVDTLGTILITLVFLFTSLSLTDLVPRDIQKSFIISYTIKAAPCILVWLMVVVEMVFDKGPGTRD